MANETTLIINETFLSIQGESTYAGLPCFFIRLAGCNLNCFYCDTTYAKKTQDGKAVAITKLLELAEASDCRLVLITGGEPMLQSGVSKLCSALINKQFQVLIETNGSVALNNLPKQVIKIMDIKGPSSGEAENFLLENLNFLNSRDEIKFVIADRADFDYALKLIKKHHLSEITNNILYSPSFGKIDPKELASWVIEQLPPGRMQLQLHKYIWSTDTRGV